MSEFEGLHICYFSGSVIDLPKKKQFAEHVLGVLEKDPKVSTWDMSEHKWLRDIIYGLQAKGLIKEEKAEYPWHIFKPGDSV